jgi:chromosome segregation ATPase
MSVKILEEEKLKLEILELKRHWIKNPQYLQILLPTILAIFSLLYAITTGLFSSKQELLELNKRQLETDISNFQKDKISLIKSNEILKNKSKLYNDSLKSKDLVLKKFENSFVKEKRKIQVLSKEIIILKSTKENYNKEIETLKKEYETKKQKYLKEIESKYFKEIDNDKRVNVQKNNIQDLKSKVKELEFKISILEKSPFIAKNKESEFKIWYLNKIGEYYVNENIRNNEDVKVLEKNFEKTQKKLETLQVKTKILKIK